MIIVCQSLGSRPIRVLELFTLVPSFFGTTCRCLSVQPVQLLPSRNIWRHISLIWPFPIDTATPHGLLMLRNCFLDFAVEHWFGCCATESGFTGDIGTIEVWLIDWLIENILTQRHNEFIFTIIWQVLEQHYYIWKGRCTRTLIFATPTGY